MRGNILVEKLKWHAGTVELVLSSSIGQEVELHLPFIAADLKTEADHDKIKKEQQDIIKIVLKAGKKTTIYIEK